MNLKFVFHGKQSYVSRETFFIFCFSWNKERLRWREPNPVRLKFKSFGTLSRFLSCYTPVWLRQRNTLLHQNLYNFRCKQFCKTKKFSVTRKNSQEYWRISRVLTMLVGIFVFQNRAVFGSRHLNNFLTFFSIMLLSNSFFVNNYSLYWARTKKGSRTRVLVTYPWLLN